MEGTGKRMLRKKSKFSSVLQRLVTPGSQDEYNRNTPNVSQRPLSTTYPFPCFLSSVSGRELKRRRGSDDLEDTGFEKLFITRHSLRRAVQEKVAARSKSTVVEVSMSTSVHGRWSCVRAANWELLVPALTPTLRPRGLDLRRSPTSHLPLLFVPQCLPILILRSTLVQQCRKPRNPGSTLWPEVASLVPATCVEARGHRPYGASSFIGKGGVFKGR